MKKKAPTKKPARKAVAKKKAAPPAKRAAVKRPLAKKRPAPGKPLEPAVAGEAEEPEDAKPKKIRKPGPFAKQMEAGRAAVLAGEGIPEEIQGEMRSDPVARRAAQLRDVADALGLNDRQRRFAELSARTDHTLEQAYRAAGYRSANRATADVSASRLLRNAKIAAFVKVLRLDTAAAGVIERDAFLEYLVEIMMTPASDIGAGHRLLQELQVDEKGYRVKMPAKLAAAESVAKMMGWYAPENDTAPVLGLDDIQTAIRNSPALRAVLREWLDEAEAGENDKSLARRVSGSE